MIYEANSISNIVLKVFSGTTIESAAKDALLISRKLENRVVLEFNDISINVYEMNDEQDILNEYYDMVNLED